MKKTFKILFPLLVIVGVLFAMLVPVSADPSYDDVWYDLSSSDVLYFMDNTYPSPFSFSGNRISCSDNLSDSTASFVSSDCFSLNSSNFFCLHFVFASTLPFELKSTCELNGAFGTWTILSFNPSTSYFTFWGGESSSRIVADRYYVTISIQPESGYTRLYVNDTGFRTHSFSSSDSSFVSGNPSLGSRYVNFVFSGEGYFEFFDLLTFSMPGVPRTTFNWHNFFNARFNAAYSSGWYDCYYPTYDAGFDTGYENGFFDGKDEGEALHANDYSNGQAYGEALHANDYSNGQAYGEALHATDFENGYNSGVASGTNVITDTVDGVFDGLLSTLGALNGFSIFGITLGGILSIAAIFLVLFFIFKVLRK